MRQADINGMLSAPDKRVKEASGLLSRLYRLALFELNITPFRWNFLLSCYLDRLAKEREMTHAMVTNERNNLRKQLNEDDMTWPMFTRGIALLDPKQCVFGVTLEFENEVTVSSQCNALDETVLAEQGIGHLTRMFADLTKALGKDVNNLTTEIDAYLSNELVRQNTQGRKRGNDKGNLRRELPGDNITWEVFKKGLRVLAPIKTTIYLDFVWTKRRKTHHPLVIRTPRTPQVDTPPE